MATIVNRNNRKRKSASDLIFEVNENDCSPLTSPEPEQTEGCASLSTSELDTSSVTSLENNNASVEVKQEPKMSKFDVDLRCMDMEVESLTSNKPFVTFIFRDEDIAKQYRTPLVKFFKSLVDIELNEESQSKLEISLWEKTIHVDIPPDSPPLANLFTVDTTPSRKSEHLPKYSRTVSAVIDTAAAESDPEDHDCPSTFFSGNCFNCCGNHSLRDCKKAKNYKRINQARMQHLANNEQKSVRYHTDLEQKFSHLVPGKISDALRRALNVRRDEIPPYVYRMRVLGYPPGWLQEAINQNTKLEVFDFDGCSVNSAKEIRPFDPDKIVEYPGFNAPMHNGFKDEYRYYKCPPYSKEYSKEAMIRHLDQITHGLDKGRCSPDSRHAPKPAAESDSNSQSSEVAEKRERSVSPTLTDLELRKKQLLLELEDGGLLDSPQASQDSGGPASQASGTPSQDGGTGPAGAPAPPASPIVSSVFGTPVLKSASPYSQLPDRDKFSQQISQVINFENLPNSTGKYEQMSKVISKVRDIVRTGHDNKS